MKAALLLATALSANAFPHLMDRDAMKAAAQKVSRRDDYLAESQAETNCGLQNCTTFDPKDQLVNVYGDNKFMAPGSGDIRGPCPGLNAAANHGYLPRNGIVTIQQAVTGLQAVYNMGPKLITILAVYAVALDGNIATETFSIGGPLPANAATGALVNSPQGISYSHSNFETDASLARDDAYLNNGDAHSVDLARFEKIYNLAAKDGTDRFTVDKFRVNLVDRQNEAIANNPYYFSGGYSGNIVAPSAGYFVVNCMSNHSAAEPAGYLDTNTFKSFFAVSGTPGNFTWNKGQERIPEYWYRRPSYAQYENNNDFDDIQLGWEAYPASIKIGGNTGKVNTFTGVDVGNLTGGALDSTTLLQGNNLACFSYQLLEQGVPNYLGKTVSDLAPATNLLNKYLGPITSKLTCPQMKIGFDLFNPFPGYQYSPTGPATNY